MSRQNRSDVHRTPLRRQAKRTVDPSTPPDDGQNEPGAGPPKDDRRANWATLALQNQQLIRSRDAAESAKLKYEHLYHRYAGLFDAAPIGYLTIDRQGRIQEANQQAARLLNTPRNDLIGLGFTSLIKDDDQDVFYFHELGCQKYQEITRFELKMKRSDGTLFDAQVQMQVLSETTDPDPGYSIALMDVSESVQRYAGFALQKESLELSIRATDMRTLLDGYVRLIKAYLQCDAVGIRLRDEAGNIPYQAHDGFSQAFYDSESPLSLHTDRCMCIAVIKGNADFGAPYFSAHGSFCLNSTSRFMADLPPQEKGRLRNTCHAHGYESVVLVPIVINDAIEGLIHAADQRANRFPARAVESIENAAQRLGLSILRFDLQERLHRSVKTLNDLSAHLLRVQEDEQRRIAMELHDGCGQDLNVMKLQLKGLENRLPADASECIEICERLLSGFDKLINDVRDIAHGLKPAALGLLGLAAATRQMIREFSAVGDLQIESHIDLLDQIDDPMAQVCLFRIFQEALTNTRKHAQATWSLITVDRDASQIRIRIQDNGVGFDASRQPLRLDGREGMGLNAMTLRCRMIGATLSLDSAVGEGTRLTIRLPLEGPKARP
jgi:PAS domain S-box-containing protein